LSVLFNKHHVTPRRRAEVTGVVVRISRPNKAVIRDVVPFFARDFARLAADAHCWIGEKPNFNIFLHVRVPALVRAVCPLANHENLMRKAGTQELNTEGKMPMKLLLISALLRS
jgi:hypothetical protein